MEHQFRDMFSGGNLGILAEVAFTFPLFLKVELTLKENNWRVLCTDDHGDYSLEVPEACRDKALWTFTTGDCGFLLRSRLSNTEKNCVRISLDVRQSENFPRVHGRAIFINNSKQKLDRRSDPITGRNMEKEWHHAIHRNFFTVQETYENLTGLNLIRQGNSLIWNREFLWHMLLETVDNAVSGPYMSFINEIRRMSSELSTDFSNTLRLSGNALEDYLIVSPATKFLLAASLKIYRKIKGTVYEGERSYYDLASDYESTRYPNFAAHEAVVLWCADFVALEEMMDSATIDDPVAINCKVESFVGFLVWLMANVMLKLHGGHYHNSADIPDLDFLNLSDPVENNAKRLVRFMLSTLLRVGPPNMVWSIEKTRKFSIYKCQINMTVFCKW